MTMAENENIKPVPKKVLGPKVTIVAGTEKTQDMISIIKKKFPTPMHVYTGVESRKKYFEDADLPVEELIYESDCLKKSHEIGGTVILDHCFTTDRFMADNLYRFTGDVIVWYTWMRFYPRKDRNYVQKIYMLPCLRMQEAMEIMCDFSIGSMRDHYADTSKRYLILDVSVNRSRQE